MIEADGIPFTQTTHIDQLRTRQVRKKKKKKKQEESLSADQHFFLIRNQRRSNRISMLSPSYIRPQHTRTKYHNSHFAIKTTSVYFVLLVRNDHSYLRLFDCQMYCRFCVEIRTRRSNFMQFTHQHGHLRLQLLCDWFIFAPVQKTLPWWKQLYGEKKKWKKEKENINGMNWIK